MRLNLIGNGFDLYHGLPSSYYYFGCFLAEHYFDFYKDMATMFDFTYGKSAGYPRDEEIEICVDNVFWSRFEEKLGLLNPLWLEESLIDDLGLEYPDDPVDIDIPEVANSHKIVEKFTEWIIKTVNTTNNYRTLNRMLGEDRLNIDIDDYFINFNYTQTLEKIYRIAEGQIFHIHGMCSLDGENSDLIVGHRNLKAIQRIKKQISDIEKETYYLQSQAVRNRLNEYQAELDVLRDLEKNVDVICHNMDVQLRLNKIETDEIWVWGLSCGDVDIPYIEKLRDMYPSARWKFSYYNEEERDRRDKLIDELNLEEASTFEFKGTNAKRIEDALVKQNGIVVF